MSELVKIGALWQNQKRDGTHFLSGKMGDATLLILPNREKQEGDKLPDFSVFVTTPKPKAPPETKN
jgi:uncharacterized protein (DUF736 family)